MKRVLAWLLSTLLAPGLALAVTTQSFLIDTSEAFEKGKLEGAAAHGDGKVTRAVTTSRIAVEGAAVASASAVGPDGAIYVGTGNQGSIYRIDQSKATGAAPKPFARIDSALVSALLWVDGTLFAGTLEKGKLLAIDAKGGVKDFATLAGAAHIWSLAYDAKRATLYAATGPEGKLFAIDRKGVAKLVHDDLAEHLLCVALDGDGRQYVGTSNGARLLRIADGAVSVLYDAPGDELGALALGPGFVATASNEFPDSGGSDAGKDGGGRGKRTRPGKGKVLSVSLDGGSVEELYRADSAHVSALEVDGLAVHVGLAQDGRIVRVQKGQAAATWADADERQIVAIHLTDKVPHFVSSDGVAVYRVTEPKAEGRWTSAVLDAKVSARFGELRFRAKGKVRLATRSGNTEVPDASWSAWSSELEAAGPIRSAQARFLQVRASLIENAELYAVEAYYLPQNLPAYVRNVRATPERAVDKSVAASTTGGKTGITLNWDVDNADADRLRYRLFHRREEHDAFLPMLPEHEVLEKSEYRWETLPVPDGYYRVRIEASDELVTPEPLVQKTGTLSPPILVDNHAPQVEGLRVANGRLTGQVSDALGPIALLEIALDGTLFRPISPKDGLLDTARESFEVELGALPAGRHIASVRATDAARNSSTGALEFSVQR